MILLSFIAGASLVVALVAWNQTRRTAKRLEQLSHMCWELKYQIGELRSQLPRPADTPSAEEAPSPPAAATNSFIPLTSLKR